MRPPSSRPPVFVDSTGRRRRIIRRTGAALAVPAVGYLILMASSLLGGPHLDTPLIPESITRPAQHPQRTPAAAASEKSAQTPAPGQETDPTRSPSDPAATAQSPSPTSGATPTVALATPITTPAIPTAGSTVVPTTATTRTPPTTTTPPGTPTSTPTSGNNGKKPTAPPGRTKTPTQP